jgi:Ni/Co efflux regulator RcnB
MTRMPIYILAALLAAAPLSAAAQDRGDRVEARQEPRAVAGGEGGGFQDRGRRPDRDDRRPSDGQRERPSREQAETPRVSMGAAVQRASSGRPGRFLGASNRGDSIVVRWEYPGGRVADIMVDGRTGRVIGER